MQDEGPEEYRPVSLQTEGVPGASRQQSLIKLAEQLLQSYYTKLSDDPNRLVPCYLEDAEIIVTGQELNMDAVYISGRHEIVEFFQSPTAERFRGSRFMVEALHPQSSPTTSFGLVLFAKGRVWIVQEDAPGGFIQSPFVHFISYAPPPKAHYGAAPELKIANEYLHLLKLVNLATNPAQLQQCSSPGPVPTKTTDLPRVSEPRVTEPVQAASPAPVQASAPIRASLPEPPVKTAEKPPANRTSRTLHAAPGFGPEIPDEMLVESITAVIRRSGGSGSCLSVTKPRTFNHTDPRYSYFFIHLDSVETTQLLVQQRNLELHKTQVRVSPSYDREKRAPNTFYRNSRPFTSQGGASNSRSALHESPKGPLPYHRSLGRGAFARGARNRLHAADRRTSLQHTDKDRPPQ